MIVTCTTCHTRYRYHDSGSEAPERGRCTRCETVIPLGPTRRAYLLAPSAASRTATRVAERATPAVRVDAEADFSPSLPGVEALDLPASDGPAVEPFEEEAGFPPAPDVETPWVDRPGELEDELPYDLEADSSPEAPIDAPAMETVSDVAVLAPPARRKQRSGARSGARGVLVTLLFTLAGAAAGYHAVRYGLLEPIAIHASVQPIHPAHVGGLLGLLVGWLGYRWTDSRS